MDIILPVFHELVLNNDSPKYLEQELSNFSLGGEPIAIQFDMSKDRIAGCCKNLLEILDKKNISTYFPYPIYCIIPKSITIDGFPAMNSVKNLPAFYKKIPKKLDDKQKQAINKNGLLTTKIVNYNPQKMIKKINEYASKQRLLSNLQKNGLFLEYLIKNTED